MYTLKDMIRATGGETSESAWCSTALGFAVRELDHLRFGGNVPLANHVERLLSAIKAGRFEVYFDEFARYIGHVAWELVRPGSDGMTECIGARGDYADPDPAAPARITGLLAPFGDVRQILGALAQSHFVEYESIYYPARRGRAGLVRRVSGEAVARLARRHGGRAEPHGDHLNRPGEIAHLARIAVDRGRNLGRILLALRGSAWVRQPLHRAMRAIRPPLALRQYQLLCESSGRPQGVITWGWLSGATLERASNRPIDRLHAGEWNEGERLCLCGWAFSARMAEQVRDFITGDWFPDEPQVFTYPSDRPGGDPLVRVWTRSQRGMLVDWMLSRGGTHG